MNDGMLFEEFDTGYRDTYSKNNIGDRSDLVVVS